jgi:hypothetical protein
LRGQKQENDKFAIAKKPVLPLVMEFITADAIAYDGQLTVNSEHVVMTREKGRGRER